MVTRNLTRTLVALLVLATASVAAADRRTGLSGSLLIEDQDDLYIFPQLITTYRNLISLDYGPDATGGQGNGVFTLGDQDMAFGMAIHRGDVLSPHGIDEILALNGPASLFTPTFAIDPATIVDFLFASGGFGLRAAVGRSFASPTAMGTSESDTFLMGEIGWGTGTRGQDTRIDLSGAISVDFASAETAGAMPTDTASGTALGVSFLMRGFSPMDNTLDLGWLANAQVSTNSVTNQAAPGDPADSLFGVDVGGGLGPSFRFGRASVAAYGVVRVGFDANDPNNDVDDDEVSTLSFVIPGVHMAAEVALTDWLRVRTGAEYGWNLVDINPAVGTGGGTQSGSFGWNAGLGLVIDQWRFDGAFEHGWVTGGPDFLGGAGGGMFMIASMTYNFDADRSGTPPAEAAPAPEPAPEPAAPASDFAPAPAPEPTPAVDATANPEGGVDTAAPTPAVAPAPAP